MTDRWRWLESTRLLQEQAFHDTDWPKTGVALAESVKSNGFAAMIELGEAAAEVGWKDWLTHDRGWINREAFIKELVDVNHFIANMLVAVDCTDEEWETAYQAKQEVNRQRQRNGYDGRSGKCPDCKRSYDDPAVDCVPAQEDVLNAPFGVAWCHTSRRYITQEVG
jgi:dimeric dUTPase (all-alpha-NTP-PPase superfamily)